MIFRSYVPHPPLDLFVDDFWLYENYHGAHGRELILPSGTFEMVFNLEEDEFRIYDPADPLRCRRFSGAVVSGPYSRSFMSDAAEEKSLLGVHFRPGGAAGLLELSAAELRDEHVDLRALWGPSADTLRERLCELGDPIGRFRFLERALMRRLAAYGGGHAAVRAALDIVCASQGCAKTRSRRCRGVEPAAAHCVVRERGRTHAESVLPHRAFSACCRPLAGPEDRRLGGARRGVRILRSVSFDLRLHRVRRCQPGRLSAAPWPPRARRCAHEAPPPARGGVVQSFPIAGNHRPLS